MRNLANKFQLQLLWKFRMQRASLIMFCAQVENPAKVFTFTPTQKQRTVRLTTPRLKYSRRSRFHPRRQCMWHFSLNPWLNFRCCFWRRWFSCFFQLSKIFCSDRVTATSRCPCYRVLSTKPSWLCKKESWTTR